MGEVADGNVGGGGESSDFDGIVLREDRMPGDDTGWDGVRRRRLGVGSGVSTPSIRKRVGSTRWAWEPLYSKRACIIKVANLQ